MIKYLLFIPMFAACTKKNEAAEAKEKIVYSWSDRFTMGTMGTMGTMCGSEIIGGSYIARLQDSIPITIYIIQ
jgi:hypothetical protein